jgi:hypothetical protein
VQSALHEILNHPGVADGAAAGGAIRKARASVTAVSATAAAWLRRLARLQALRRQLLIAVVGVAAAPADYLAAPWLSAAQSGWAGTCAAVPARATGPVR